MNIGLYNRDTHVVLPKQQYLYRTKLVYIEAWQWKFNLDQLKAPEWMDNALAKWPSMGGAAFWPDGNHDDASEWRDKPHLAINTLEGTMIASPGDFIIQGLQGEIYPCKPEIFAKKYEQAAAPPHGAEGPTRIELAMTISEALGWDKSSAHLPTSQAYQAAEAVLNFIALKFEIKTT